ncbi:MAG: hypothetical protein IJW50_02015 [Clostridia bacterium]|nr:hypothetical protein [Clostridia bacterium]
MERFKQIMLRVLFPHPIFLWLLTPIAAALLIYAFADPNANEIAVYASYGISFYALVILSVRVPAIVAWIKRFKSENRYARLYLSDAALRAKVSLYSSFGINLLFALFQAWLGVYHGSFWFYTLAVYYASLAFMRFFLLRDIKSFDVGLSPLREWKRYRFCGWVLLTMDLALALMVFFMVYWKRGSVHHEITTIAIAAFTFFSLTMAIINVIKYRKYQSPLLSAVKAISLASASVSMLTLETAMLNSFGQGESELFRTVMLCATGAAVCLFVLGMAIYMVTRAARAIKEIKKGTNINAG